MKNIGIIGMGNMGFAIANGIKKSYPECSLAVADKNQDLANKMSEVLQAKAFSAYPDFFKLSEIILIAVKPQHLDSLFSDIVPFTRNKKIITIAAGKKISYFTEHLHTSQVVRFMPNIAAKASHSLTGITFGEEVSETFREEARQIADSFGEVVIIPEALMPAITGLSGSGIAYVFSFIHALALGGTHSGIPYNTSLEIALKTVEGALSLLTKEKSNPITSLTNVISAAGTTIEGIKALEEHGFTNSVMDAVKKASDRAKDFEN